MCLWPQPTFKASEPDDCAIFHPARPPYRTVNGCGHRIRTSQELVYVLADTFLGLALYARFR